MISKYGDYYLGLDIGTDSVGWAVTDTDYRLLNFNRKPMWGIHLFESGETAKGRRTHRIARRRLQRRKQRISLLREFFNPEISKVDEGFFQRLDESSLYKEDKSKEQRNSLFYDASFSDKDFFKRYPTVYHLRSELIHNIERPDIRHLYLAIHHIIKYRGHFLFKGSGDEIPEFHELLEYIITDVQDNCGFGLDVVDADEIKTVLADRNIGINEKVRKLSSLFGVETSAEKEFVKLISGGVCDISKMFSDDNMEDIKLSFRKNTFEEEFEEKEEIIGPENVQTIKYAKQLYDWSLLSDILRDFQYISDSMVDEYRQHQSDLKLLKKVVRVNIPERYDAIFKSNKEKSNYCSYINKCGKKKPDNTCNHEDFCKFVLKELSKAELDKEAEHSDMIGRLKNQTFMPKQRTSKNSVIPYNLHKKELKAILDKACVHYDFLNITDQDGLSIAEKILMLQEFRIPYYVGPLGNSPRTWAVRKDARTITPWNFEETVDLDASAEKFIENLTNNCTYLIGEPVLPKQSLLYSRYVLFNEINKLRINGEPVPVNVKHEIIEQLFLGSKGTRKTGKKRLMDFLRVRGYCNESDELTGIDDTVKADLKTEITLRELLGDRISERNRLDEIIRIITIFGDERIRLRKKLIADHSDFLSLSEIDTLSRLSLKGWGKLSEKFLTGITVNNPSTGMDENIIRLLENSNENLMQIIQRDDVKRQIDSHNQSLMGSPGKISYDLVDELYVSPSVRRGIWRALRIVDDILKVTGHPPKKVFIETTREHKESKRTVSRKKALEDLLKNCESEDCEQLKSDIDKKTDSDFRNRNLFLYYTQLGRCMYCGKKLDINGLKDNNQMDRDHIYPQSKTKDDSISNNLVLVCKGCNQAKGDRYPLPREWQNRMNRCWTYLRDKGFMTPQKYSRLVRTTEFTEDELCNFINRQLVETNQSVKAVIDVLKRVFEEQTDVIYVKGKMVSDFRQQHGMIKCRSVNDYHHAKDAYLNIVVGNVYDTKFTKNYWRFLRTNEHYNISKMYEWDVVRGGEVAWKAGPEGSISTISKFMQRNNILFTTYPIERKGQLFDENLKGKGSDYFNRKRGLDPEKYGGFGGIRAAYYTLLEIEDKKGKKKRRFESVPIHLANHNPSSNDLIDYFKNLLNANSVRFLIPKIKMDTMFEIDGYRCVMSGGNVNVLLMKNGEQLIMPYSEYDYCKKIENFIRDVKERKAKPVMNYGIDSEKNSGLYDYFMNKCKVKPYLQKFCTLAQRMEENFEGFKEAKLDDQVMILYEILKHFQCNAYSANFGRIGGGMMGRITINKNLPGGSLALVNQSPSGLFENIRYIDT